VPSDAVPENVRCACLPSASLLRSSLGSVGGAAKVRCGGMSLYVQGIKGRQPRGVAARGL